MQTNDSKQARNKHKELHTVLSRAQFLHLSSWLHVCAEIGKYAGHHDVAAASSSFQTFVLQHVIHVVSFPAKFLLKQFCGSSPSHRENIITWEKERTKILQHRNFLIYRYSFDLSCVLSTGLEFSSLLRWTSPLEACQPFTCSLSRELCSCKCLCVSEQQLCLSPCRMEFPDSFITNVMISVLCYSSEIEANINWWHSCSYTCFSECVHYLSIYIGLRISWTSRVKNCTQSTSNCASILSKTAFTCVDLGVRLWQSGKALWCHLIIGQFWQLHLSVCIG